MADIKTTVAAMVAVLGFALKTYAGQDITPIADPLIIIGVAAFGWFSADKK